MLNILFITLPVFGVIAIGYAATRFKVMSPADIRTLGLFVLKFALPALVFTLLSQRHFAEIWNPAYLAVYGAASLSVFTLMLLTATLLQGRTLTQGAIQAMGSSVSNSGYVGYPIAVMVAGPAASVALALCMIIENALMIPLALTLAESGNNGGEPRPRLFFYLIARLAKNPLILAIVAGAAVSFLGIKLPVPVVKPLQMLAMASSATALFAVGGTLAGLQIKGTLGDIARIVTGKLTLHPLAVFLLLLLVPTLDPAMKKAMLIYASAPMLSVLALLGQPYGQEQTGAAALMVATLLSFLTISGLLLLI
ncbi:MAG: AEC family transporter [Acidocella sp.]|nr:AEC family transporter [Acidocella sp.]